MPNNNKSDNRNRPNNHKGNNAGRNRNYFRDNSKNGVLSNKCNGNDASWYNHNPQALRDAANIAWNGVVGTLPPTISVNGNIRQPYRRPGISVLHFIPTYGQSFTEDDGLVSAGNIAAQNIYTWVRHENSGSRVYESADLFMYLIALDSLYMLMAEGRRLYGLSQRYSTQNRYWGQWTIQALGYTDAADIIANPVAVRSFVNTAMVRIASINAPAQMNMFKRHFWLNDHIWLDDNSERASAYAYRASTYFKWSATTSTGGTELIPRPAPTNFMEYQDLVNELINSMLGDEDVGTISGDIRKAYKDAIFSLELMPENYTLTPEYNREVLRQIQNTMFLGASAATTSITQAGGQFKSTIALTSTVGAWENPFPATTEPGLDTPEYNMVILRNRFTVKQAKNSGEGPVTYSAGIKNAGSEVFTHMSLFQLKSDGTSLIEYKYSSYEELNPSIASMIKIANLSSLEKHPCIMQVSSTADLNNVAIFDFDEYTYVTPEMIERMNDVAILSLWNVPI